MNALDDDLANRRHRTQSKRKILVLVANNQIQHLYGEPLWLRSGFTNRFVSVAIRAVQLDFFGPDMLRWIIENYADKRLVVHLGDALNVACSAEETFLRTAGAAQHGWVLAPGNHDAFYFGNGDFSQREWARACNTADGRGYPFAKDQFVEAYLAALSRSVPSSDQREERGARRQPLPLVTRG